MKHCKQALINKCNQNKNQNRKSHLYHKVDKVLLSSTWKTVFNQDVYVGTYTITTDGNNRIVCAYKVKRLPTFTAYLYSRNNEVPSCGSIGRCTS